MTQSVDSQESADDRRRHERAAQDPQHFHAQKHHEEDIQTDLQNQLGQADHHEKHGALLELKIGQGHIDQEREQ